MLHYPFLIEIISGSSVALQAQKSDSSGQKFALTGARIYPAPDANPIVNGVIVVAGEKIVSVGEASMLRVPRGMRAIDCSILSGLPRDCFTSLGLMPSFTVLL
jgi:hypothetical protein